MTTFETVQSVIAEIMGIDSDKVKAETDIVNDLQATSLDLVEIVTLLEEKYEISILDADLAKLECVGDVVEYINDRIKVRS